jgi:hypothetical protein
MPTPKQKFISNKIKIIENEGIRGKKVPVKQAVAVAYSMTKKKPQLSQRDQYANALKKATAQGGSSGIGVGP